MRKGLTEDEATAASGDLAEASLPPDQIAALKLADLLTEPDVTPIDQALMDELLEHFDQGQILELAAALSVASGWQRMIETFGIRPDHWSEATPLPPRPA
ncbi:MAG: hypothetical protein ACFCVK_08470 [Acidimicrobiales bacterium]